MTAALAACALLASCGSGGPQRSPLVAAVGTMAQAGLGQIVGRGGGTAAASGPVTRADLEAAGTPILRAAIAARAADLLLTVGATQGNIVTWTTPDGTTFTLRDGVLIQTRGLGADLMSSQAPTIGQLLQDGGTHQRRYFFLGEDDRQTRRTYDCTVDVVGPETIEIFDRPHAVTRVNEECARPQGSITNAFWIEGSTIRRSRQLASGPVGFIVFERVVD